MRLFLGVLLSLAGFAWADEFQTGKVGDITFVIPPGWNLEQIAHSEMTEFAVLEKGEESIRLFAEGATPRTLDTLFSSEAQNVEGEGEIQMGAFTWKTALKKRQVPDTRAATAPVYSFGFVTHYRGRAYYGFSRSPSEQRASETARVFMAGLLVPLSAQPFQTSLTVPDFDAKKYYLGFGTAAPRDPAMMQNEVQYDVRHTHAIFSGSEGGGYDSKLLIGNTESRAAAVREAMKNLSQKITDKDMYVQYSSGHGVRQGLVLGTRFDELVQHTQIRDFILGLKAKEIIIFTMACYSGALVEAINAKKAEWQDWRKQGRTLMILTSSTGQETSATGPGRDQSEPGAPNGSAGSAFGHSLWKALTGTADGFVDGVKDGFIDLGEIREYSRYRTRQLGRHTPVETGVYSPHLIMNRVPNARFVQQMEGGTESLSDDQISERIRQLDEAFRVESLR